MVKFTLHIVNQDKNVYEQKLQNKYLVSHTNYFTSQIFSLNYYSLHWFFLQIIVHEFHFVLIK
jgi:hypothetical protein